MSSNSGASGGSKDSPSYDESIEFSLTSSLVSTSNGCEEVFRSNEHSAVLLKHMQTYYDNKQLCDVVVVAGIDGTR